MSDDIEILSGLDQSISYEPAPQTMQELDSEFQTFLDHKDIQAALEKLNDFIGTARVAGIMLTKWIYRLYQHWHSFEVADNFFDVLSDRIGYKEVTLRRYISIWDMYENKVIPPELESKVMGMPLRQQVPIAAAITQGFELTNQNWEQIANTPDLSTLGKTLRQIKGQTPRSSGLFITLKRNGDLICSSGGRQVIIGHLEVNSTDPIVMKAVERLSSGLLKE